MNSLVKLDPSTYNRHFIHGTERCWAETNCYVDVLIELIHSFGFDPVAALPFTISIDFEVDQWTFFKYRHEDLRKMYGMDIQELNPWLSLTQHIEEQVSAGRAILVEVDSFYLPDTVGTAYQANHVKSTIAVNEISVERQHMGYFHGQGYYHLTGSDFRELFQTEGIVNERMLPPYIELVKFQKMASEYSNSEMLTLSLAAFTENLELLPDTNPFEQFKKRFLTDFNWLREKPIDSFHAYSFATLRQYGACFELVQTYLEWLTEKGQKNLCESTDAFRLISETSKIFQFKLARSIAKRRDIDASAIDKMSDLWETATNSLKTIYL